jgi:glutamyl/glutaminyl-tRNA synthetase
LITILKSQKLISLKVAWKGEDLVIVKKHIITALDLLGKIADSDWNALGIKDALWSYAETVGKGNVLWPIRFTLSGKDKSPDPFVLAEILGKEETLARLNLICEKLA